MSLGDRLSRLLLVLLTVYRAVADKSLRGRTLNAEGNTWAGSGTEIVMRKGNLTVATLDSHGWKLRAADLLAEQTKWMPRKECLDDNSLLETLEAIDSAADCAVRCNSYPGCVALSWREGERTCALFEACEKLEEATGNGSNQVVTGLLMYTDQKIICHAVNTVVGPLTNDDAVDQSVPSWTCRAFCQTLLADDHTLAAWPGMKDEWDSENIFRNKKAFPLSCGPSIARCICEDVLSLPAEGLVRGVMKLTTEDRQLRQSWEQLAKSQLRVLDGYECANFGGTLEKRIDSTPAGCASRCAVLPECVAFTWWTEKKLCTLKSKCNELGIRADSEGKLLRDAITGLVMYKNNTVICHKDLHNLGGAYGKGLEPRNACRDWCESLEGSLNGISASPLNISLSPFKDQWSPDSIMYNLKSFGLSCGQSCSCADVKSLPPEGPPEMQIPFLWEWQLAGRLDNNVKSTLGDHLPLIKITDAMKVFAGKRCYQTDMPQVQVKVGDRDSCASLCHERKTCVAFTYSSPDEDCRLLDSCTGLDQWEETTSKTAPVTGLLIFSDWRIICHNNTERGFNQVPDAHTDKYRWYLSESCSAWCATLDADGGSVVQHEASWVNGLDVWNAEKLGDNTVHYGFSCDKKHDCQCSRIKKVPLL